MQANRLTGGVFFSFSLSHFNRFEFFGIFSLLLYLNVICSLDWCLSCMRMFFPGHILIYNENLVNFASIHFTDGCVEEWVQNILRWKRIYKKLKKINKTIGNWEAKYWNFMHKDLNDSYDPKQKTSVQWTHRYFFFRCRIRNQANIWLKREESKKKATNNGTIL